MCSLSPAQLSFTQLQNIQLTGGSRPGLKKISKLKITQVENLNTVPFIFPVQHRRLYSPYYRYYILYTLHTYIHIYDYYM